MLSVMRFVGVVLCCVVGVKEKEKGVGELLMRYGLFNVGVW